MDDETKKTADALIAEYEALLRRTARMLGLAEQGSWDNLLEEEEGYSADIERIRRIDATAYLAEGDLQRGVSLLGQILEQSLVVQKALQSRRRVLNDRVREYKERGQQIDQYLGWEETSGTS